MLINSEGTKREFLDPEQVFQKYLRRGQHWNKKVIGMQDARWQPLDNETYMFGITLPKGTIFKCFETSNFGWVVLHPEAKTIDGNTPSQRIFKY